jgi:hypothetical protein
VFVTEDCDMKKRRGYGSLQSLGNPFIDRTASHPWGAMTRVTAFFGAGSGDSASFLLISSDLFG